MHKLFIEEHAAIDAKVFEDLFLGKPARHNDIACQALLEYELLYDKFDKANYEQIPSRHGGTTNGKKLHNFIVGSPPRMQNIAEKYGITTDDMKAHRKCMPKEYGY